MAGRAEELGFALVVRRALFLGLLLGPLTIVVHYATDIGATAEFVLAAASLIPLAWLIGEATEHAAGWTTRSQCTSHRRHSTSSCGRSGISTGATGAWRASAMP